MSRAEQAHPHAVPGQRRGLPAQISPGVADPARARVLPRGVAQVRPEAPAAVLMVDLGARQVLYANEVAAQMAPDLTLPVSVDAWAAIADLRDLDGEALDETAHPLSRIARFEPVAGQGVSAARSSELGGRREPLWVVALPLDDAPNLRGHALVVFLPVRDREELQERAQAAHSRAVDEPTSGVADRDEAAVREAAVLATGLSFTVADARTADMPLTWVNPAFTAVTGYTFAMAVGHNCRFLQGPGTDRDTTARMRVALEQGRSVTETLLNYRADGTAFWNQVAMSPILDAAGAVTHYVGIQTDVSGRVAADAERDRALAAEHAARAEAEAAHGRLQLLAEVTTQLSETTEAEAALERLAHLVVPALGDFAILAVVADDTTPPVTAPAGGTTDTDTADTATATDTAAAATDTAAGSASDTANDGTRAPAVGAAAARIARGRHGLRDVAWWHHDPALRQVLGELARHRLTSLEDAGRGVLATLLTSAASTAAGVTTAAAEAAAAADGGTASPGRRSAAQDGIPVVEDLAAMMRPGTARDSLLALAPTSMVTWALRSRGRVQGLMTIATGPDRAPLDAADMALGNDIATRAGLALDRARLFRQQRDLAEGLQRSLLQLPPAAAPAHVQVAVRYLAAAEAAQVGGDFYDVFTQPDGAAVVVIGDVMGHDTQAAAEMAQLRSIVRTLGMVAQDSPAVVLQRTDAMMRASGIATTATAAILRLAVPHAGQTVVQWSNAGHPPPLVIAADGAISYLQAPNTDLLLGVDPLTTRQLHQARLDVGGTLVLYTDGLVERRDQPLTVGLARLLTAAQAAADHALGLEETVNAVLAAMLAAPSSDDVAIIAVRLR